MTGNRRGLAALLIPIFIVGLAIAEVAVLIAVGQWLGVLPTIFLMVGTAVVGAWLTAREGTRTWSKLQKTLESGQMPTGELTDAALVLVGGVMLMLPGFITDAVGLFLLLPFTRPLARKVVGWIAAGWAARRGVDVAALRQQTRRASDHTTIIEGETIEDGGAANSPTVLKGEIET